MNNNLDAPLNPIIDNVQTWIKTGDEHILRQIIQEINYASPMTKKEDLLMLAGYVAGEQVAQSILEDGTKDGLRYYGKKLGKLLDVTESKATYYAIKAFREHMEKVESPFSYQNSNGKIMMTKDMQEIFANTVSHCLSSIDSSKKVDRLIATLTDYEKYSDIQPRKKPAKVIENKLPEKMKLDVEGFRKKIWGIDDTSNNKKLK